MTRLSLKTEFTTNDLVVNNGTADNANNGDKLRNAFGKLIKSIDRAEANFVELYAAGGVDLTGYATEAWVTSQSYITLADVAAAPVLYNYKLYLLQSTDKQVTLKAWLQSTQ